eukprot:7267111-Pyramimonas_sp.AAC.2
MSQITPNVFQILPTLKASQHHIAAMAKRAPLCKAKQTKRRLVHSPPRRKQSHTPQTLWLRCHFSRALPTDLPHYISFWDPPFHRVSIDPSCHGMEKPHDPPPPMGMVLGTRDPARYSTRALASGIPEHHLLPVTCNHSPDPVPPFTFWTNARCAPLLAKGSVGAGAEQAVHEGGGPQAHHAGPLHPAGRDCAAGDGVPEGAGGGGEDPAAVRGEGRHQEPHPQERRAGRAPAPPPVH